VAALLVDVNGITLASELLHICIDEFELRRLLRSVAMEAQPSPLGKSVSQTMCLVGLRKALADVSANLERVLVLKTKLEAVAANTDKGLRDTRIHQRAEALDKKIEEYEGRRVQLMDEIQMATGKYAWLRRRLCSDKQRQKLIKNNAAGCQVVVSF
jgi:hypothetical protein